MTPSPRPIFLSRYDTGHGFRISKNRKSRKASVTDLTVGRANSMVIAMPATSSMTMADKSCSPVAFSNCSAAHHPTKNTTTSQMRRYFHPPASNVNAANGMPPIVPHVPGAGKARPQPNHVASHAQGFVKSTFRNRSRLKVGALTMNEHGGNSLCGNAFATAGESEAFRGCCLDADLLWH